MFYMYVFVSVSICVCLFICPSVHSPIHPSSENQQQSFPHSMLCVNGSLLYSYSKFYRKRTLNIFAVPRIYKLYNIFYLFNLKIVLSLFVPIHYLCCPSKRVAVSGNSIKGKAKIYYMEGLYST